VKALGIFLAGVVVGALAVLALFPPTRRVVVEGAPPPAPARPAEEERVELPSPVVPEPARIPATAKASPPPPEPPVDAAGDDLGLVTGEIRGTGRTPIPGAVVRIAVATRILGPGGQGEWEFRPGDLVSTVTNEKGWFETSVPSSRLVRVEVEAPGFAPEREHRLLPPPPFEERFSFQLRRTRWTEIRGQLLDPLGAPLSAETIREMFPSTVEVSAEPEIPDERELFGECSIVAHPPGALRFAGNHRGEASIDPASASFSIQVRPGSSGFVSVFLRDEVVAERPWSEGDPDLEFRLDPAALEVTWGTLRIDVLDGTTGFPVAHADVRVERDSPLWLDPHDLEMHFAGRSLELKRLPPAEYVVSARAPGFAEAVTRVALLPGSVALAVVSLHPPARVRLRLVPLEDWLSEKDGEVEGPVAWFDPRGRWRNSVSRLDALGEERWVIVDEAPADEGYFVYANNFLRVTLASGANPDLDFPIRKPREVIIRYEGPGSPSSGGGPKYPAQTQLLTFPDAVPFRQVLYSSWSGDAFDESLPPGRYTFELEAPGAERVRRDILVGFEEKAEIVLR
jgi:hypothetical protein